MLFRSRLAVSLDGSNATIHDEFRRVNGSFAHGLRILREAQEIGLTTQVNTVVRKANLDDMEAMCRLMTELGIVFWEVFFLVPMGRARKEDVASAEGFEAVFQPALRPVQDRFFRHQGDRRAPVLAGRHAAQTSKIGRASCRERV